MARLIVFDFDNTITKVHSCLYPNFLQAPLNAILADPIVFVNLVILLRRSGRDVAIASYGRKSLILGTMNRLFDFYAETSPFNEVNTVTPLDASKEYGIRWPECYEPPKGFSKNNLLMILQSRTSFWIPNEEILLIDDSDTNCVNAIEAGYQATNIFQIDRSRKLMALTDPPHLTYIRVNEREFEKIWNSFLRSY